MRISVSQIKQHRSCPMLAHYEYDLLRKPAGRVDVAPSVGTIAHAAFASLLLKQDWKAAAQASFDDLEAQVREATPFDSALKMAEVQKQWEPLDYVIEHAWRTPDDWEILATEKEMSIVVGKHEIVGKLDTVVRWNGRIWHLQHKTVPTNKNLATYAEQQRTDWHESVYQRMAEAWYDDVAGTLLNCIRKLSYKAAIEKPATAFQHFFLARSEEEVDSALLDLEQEIDDIEKEMRGERRVIKNRSYCAGPYGNSICAYKEVCDGFVDINDDTRFITVEPRYTQPTEDV